MRGVQASPVGEKEREEYNAVSTAGLFMGGGEERKNKTAHKLSSGRTPCLKLLPNSRKEGKQGRFRSF